MPTAGSPLSRLFDCQLPLRCSPATNTPIVWGEKDFSDTGIAAARLEADRKGLANARFEERDAAHLGEAGFTSIEVARLDGDIANAYIIASKS
jgi:hypothetical protein